MTLYVESLNRQSQSVSRLSRSRLWFYRDTSRIKERSTEPKSEGVTAKPHSYWRVATGQPCQAPAYTACRVYKQFCAGLCLLVLPLWTTDRQSRSVLWTDKRWGLATTCRLGFNLFPAGIWAPYRYRILNRCLYWYMVFKHSYLISYLCLET